MLESALIALLGVTGIVAAHALLVTGLVAVSIRVFRVDRYVVISSIEGFFYQLRWRDYLNRGAMSVPWRLRRRVRKEAKLFLKRVEIGGGSPCPPFAWSARFILSNLALDDLPKVESTIAKTWPDLPSYHQELGQIIPRFKSPLEKRFRWHSRVWTAAWALVCAYLFSSRVPDVFAQLLEKPTGLWQKLNYLGLDSLSLWMPQQWSNLVDVLTTALLTTLVVGMGQHVLERRYLPEILDPGDDADQQSHPPPAACAVEPHDDGERGMIGRPRQAIRALNFAGGGFDTIMQLGVTHALLVLQGRAPDVVMGLSTGALQASVVAEVLQAGEEQEEALLKEQGLKPGRPAEQWQAIKQADTKEGIQRVRVLARMEKLRFYIDAAQRAPNEIFDALMPDALQIDSREPLRPLEQPRFPHEEREEREEAAVSRSGLVRLYNDLLSVHLSVGTITRFVRRWLGFVAARETKQRSARVFIRFTEALRLWILVGLNLHRIAPLLWIFVRPLFRNPRRTVTQTAGALLFKFKPAEIAAQFLRNFISFVALVAVWVLGSLIVPAPIAFAFFATHALRDSGPGWLGLLIVVYGALSVGIGYLVVQLSDFNRTSWSYELGEVTKGVLVYLVVTLIWLAILAAILAMPVWFYVHTVVGAEPASYVEPFMICASVLWAMLAIFLVAMAIALWRSDTPYLDQLLGAFHLSSSLFQTDGLKAYLTELFDPHYYGKPNVDDVIRDSLANRTRGTRRHSEPKTIAHYSCKKRREPIEVGIVVANVVTGKLEVVSRKENVIDGLLAAVSVTPFFPPRKLGGKIFINGANISNEPTSALMTLLRNRILDNSPIVHIYSVSPFPVSQRSVDSAGTREGAYLNLMDVIFRALSLQRIRDASLERRLTELFTRVIPREMPQVSTSENSDDTANKCFRAWVTPIELEHPTSLNARILQAPKEQRRQAIAESIAEGCRAAMQVMIANAIEEIRSKPGVKNPLGKNQRGLLPRPSFVYCAEAVGNHFESRDIAPELKAITIAGKHDRGPGLNEICKHCALTREGREQPYAKQALKVKNWEQRGPSWPHEREYEEPGLERDLHFVRRNDSVTSEVPDSLDALKHHNESVGEDDRWPRPRCTGIGQERPTVSLLFSGGVFRGVYQMGVLNALSEIGLKPDLIAGASVGSITAAMVARTFSVDEKSTLTERDQRQARIARLAAVYLAVDRLIVTDRLADFVRNLTLRAGDTGFSVRQADRFFRKYDYPGFREFDRNARKVLAGIERLLYINPYQLNALVRAFRHGDLRTVSNNLKEHVQQWLDRMQVGLEVLGAEPLGELIDEYVAKDIGGRHPGGPTFDDLRENTGIHFLATATNLSQGRLEVLGEKPVFNGEGAAILREGLLTSSAFPAVFRPRWAWELFPDSTEEDQYVDGGVTDNLPIDAVAQFLTRAASQSSALISKRPPHPHLVVAASLQVDSGPVGVLDSEALQTSWPTLLSRARELSYNIKLDRYASAERKLRNVSRNCGKPDMTPVDIEVVAVKPEWLCGTFAFHPMTGFQRSKQAKSIAHGCASTLLRFARMREESGDSILRGWGIEPGSIPEVSNWSDGFEQWTRVRRQGSSATDNMCWLRPGTSCPFSKAELTRAELDLPQSTQRELTAIHNACPHRHTHLRKV